MAAHRMEVKPGELDSEKARKCNSPEDSPFGSPPPGYIGGSSFHSHVAQHLMSLERGLPHKLTSYLGEHRAS